MPQSDLRVPKADHAEYGPVEKVRAFVVPHNEGPFSELAPMLNAGYQVFFERSMGMHGTVYVLVKLFEVESAQAQHTTQETPITAEAVNG